MALPPSLHTHISQMVFHKIRREDLVLVGAAFKLLTSFAVCFLSHMKTTVATVSSVTNDVIIS